MEARATLRYARISPRKVSIVMDLIRNKPLAEAQAILQYTPKAACEPLLKLVNSAAANAENNFDMDRNNLYVAECYVEEGYLSGNRWLSSGNYSGGDSVIFIDSYSQLG